MATATKSAKDVLAGIYWTKLGVIRKHFAGNGKDKSNTAAEALIASGTVRWENSNQINFKASIAALTAIMTDAGINQTKEQAPSLADVI